MVPVVDNTVPQFSEIARDSINTFLKEIVKHWEGVRGGKDADAVHDMRVATRRLRASLSVFQPAFPPRHFEKFERKIAYLTDALGEARDTDVFLEFMNSHIEALTLEQSNQEFGLKEFVKHLEKRREAQQADLLKTLRRLDPEELQRDGERLLNDLPKDSTEKGVLDA
jgi:CHAD domain-containing protein